MPQTPERQKEYRREYNQRPEVKARARARARARYEASPRGLRWKGDEVSYFGMHLRLKRDLDLTECLNCGSIREVQAALIHGRGNKMHGNLRYSVRTDDYMPLCVRCHSRYDKTGRLW